MHVVQQGYFSRIYWNMFKSVRHSVAVDRVVGRDTNVEKEIKRPIRCDDTNIAYTGALVSILDRKAIVWFWHKGTRSVLRVAGERICRLEQMTLYWG